MRKIISLIWYIPNCCRAIVKLPKCEKSIASALGLLLAYVIYFHYCIFHKEKLAQYAS